MARTFVVLPSQNATTGVPIDFLVCKMLKRMRFAQRTHWQASYPILVATLRPLWSAYRHQRETAIRFVRMINDFSSPRVLVVEDHPDTADLLARYARLLGCQVEIAVDGESALETAVSFLPQIVLLDIGLPDIDGWEVARILRKQLEPIHPVLIAVTCFRGHEDQMRSKAAGIDHHLMKPDFRQDLMRLLMPLVGRS